ncbi:response regulator [Marinobacter sp. BSs20148]|jgi:DNA-binding NarL/FixJ family response regulator|uniref:response regulator n=1 Tax=Marinobacter sp. BSs20148 TaxID=490759 RepID=UPI0002776A48|nr:response regulator [Marinobacter sp. BSs20148]AFP30345.1 Chemotaxis protein CheY [Marinobacter sp. BSs20148]
MGTTLRPAAFGKLNYLVVDDVDSFRLSMRTMLSSCGAEKIELASDAKQAIDYCSYNKVDILLCDYNFGDGRNGQQILEELRFRKLLSHTAVFMMITAETSRHMVLAARDCQPDAYLAKPINRAVLHTRLSSLLQQREALLPINRELDRHNYEKAVALCLQAQKTQPRYNTWLLKTLGDLYFRLGELDQAESIYNDTLISRDIPWALLGRCRVLLAKGKGEDSVLDLQRLVNSNPDCMEAYDLLAEGLATMGNPVQSQQILEAAVQHSPNALLRQKKLALQAEMNADMESAVKAWRRTVSLSQHSIHESPDHYLALSSALADLSESADSNLDKSSSPQVTAAQIKEANTTLAAMEKRFTNDANLSVRSRILQCRLLAAEGCLADSQALLDKVRQELTPVPPTISADTEIEYAKALFLLNSKEEAKNRLAQLAHRYRSDADIQRKVESLLDEPVGFRQKLQARSLNHEAIDDFQNNRIDEAIGGFSAALKIVPDQIALNLNLIQVILKRHKSLEQEPEMAVLCRSALERLSSLQENHSQFERYSALKERVEALLP